VVTFLRPLQVAGNLYAGEMRVSGPSGAQSSGHRWLHFAARGTAAATRLYMVFGLTPAELAIDVGG
jgi:hypothetical protein